MIAQMLAVIGSHDHQRIFDHSLPAQLVEQQSQPPIEISNTIVVHISCHLYVVDGKCGLVNPDEALEHLPLSR